MREEGHTVNRPPWKKLVALAAGLALSAGIAAPAGAQTTSDQRTSAAPTSAAEIVSAMQPGWNLGNSLDTQCCSVGGDETAWGNPRVDDTFFRDIKAEGFNSVRIPVSWGSEDPVLEDASGTSKSLLIPTAFHGDQLATMEAVYADGTAAGPDSWTTYKAFWDVFKPSYRNGTIELTEKFFSEITDGSPVTLKFHFWSGKTVEYTVTRNGTAVTGTAVNGTA